jgi:hypothetical protein
MVRNFAGAVAKCDVSHVWVSRFLHRREDKLTTKKSARIHHNRHQAGSYKKYDLYLQLQHAKMQEDDVEPRNTYNIDEKGFFIGITTCLKRVFSKAV